jgi:hypothetical protein
MVSDWSAAVRRRSCAPASFQPKRVVPSHAACRCVQEGEPLRECVIDEVQLRAHLSKNREGRLLFWSRPGDLSTNPGRLKVDPHPASYSSGGRIS